MLIEVSVGRAIHLGYCFNVLPGETLEALHDQLSRFCEPLRRSLGVDRMGVGLWIAHEPAAALAGSETERHRLRRALDSAGLYAFTLNGFPYGGFHAPRVKERVFTPSWAEPARLDYTVHLAQVLAALLPADVGEGTISTVPLGAAGIDLDAAVRNVGAAAEALASLRGRTGRSIRLCLEPEPGTAFERADALARRLEALDHRDHLGICFDCCHAAVVDESAADAWSAFASTGVRCGKIQVSSALVVEHPDRDADRGHLAEFDEPRFLHQVRCDRGGAMDLPEAIANLDRSSPWRVHFHVPVHRDRFEPFSTTSGSIAPALATALAASGPAPHIEVETYTWNVLPAADRPGSDADLIAGMAAEIEWTVDRIRQACAKLP